MTPTFILFAGLSLFLAVSGFALLWILWLRSQKNFTESHEKIFLQSKALEAAANGIVITDTNGKVLWANAAVSRLTGYSTKELIGQNPRTLKSGKHDALFYKKLWETILSGQVWDGEIINKRKDGSFYVERMTITPVKGEGKEIISFIAVKEDVTEQKMISEALHESDERYSLALSAAGIGTWMWNFERQSFFLDEYARPLFGAQHLDFSETYDAFLNFIHEDDRGRINQELKDAAEKHDYYHTTFRVVWPDQSVHNLAIRGRVFKGESGKVERMSGVFWDVTEHKMLEAQLRQSQKMEAVGRLAGGIAHDFNNLLTIINCYSELLALRISPDDKAYSHVIAIKDAGERAALLTKQLVAFSRREITSLVLIDLNKTLVSLRQMLVRLVPENIKIEVESDPSLAQIRADLGQVNQVLMNLVVNARDALPQGGKIKIKAQNVFVSNAEAEKNPGMKEGEFVRLTVSDNGEGMPEHVCKKIFEPFFTTKAQGKGTGLGLATCYGIVKQSNGYIRVESEVGKGTTFEIDFPVASDQGSSENDSETRTKQSAHGGRETILLVEDERQVRELVTHILTGKGYQVLTAEDGSAAQEVLSKTPRIHLVLTDLVMPRMGGRQLADLIKKKWPRVKIIFMSGHTDDEPARKVIAELGLPFLQKPFTPDALALKLRQTLDGKSISEG